MNPPSPRPRLIEPSAHDRPFGRRPGSARLRVAAWAWLIGLGAAAGAACYEPPQPEVSFSCRASDEPACPEDYRCEADGCCHRIGSDVEANWAGCSLVGSMDGTGDGTGDGTESGSDPSGGDTGETAGGESDTSGA